MASSRDDFTPFVKRMLATRVAFRCSNPQCRKTTVSPDFSRSDKTTSDGVACHIAAASIGGPRFDDLMNHTDRINAANGIWLCNNCSRMIDGEPTKYPVGLLQEWKLQAELEIESEFRHRPLTGQIAPETSAELVWTSNSRFSYGISPLNDYSKPIHWLDLIHTFKISWSYQLTIFNDTGSLIRNIRTTSPISQLKIDIIPIQKTALESLQTLEVRIRFVMIADLTGKQAEELMNNQLPKDLSELEIQIQYSSISRHNTIKKLVLVRKQILRFPD